MSSPHADRDHSEQPVAGPLCARCGQPALGFATINGVRYCHSDERSCYTEQCHENPTHARLKARLDARKAARQAATPSTATAGSDPTQGTSRPVSARVVRASEAQVEAALDVLGCGAYQNRRGVVVCIHERHEHYGAWSERGCPVAAAVADAVVAAGDADEVTRLRAEVDGFRDLADRSIKRALRAEAEWDALRETVARVEALAKVQAIHCRVKWRTDEERTWLDILAIIESAALSGPSPAQTPATATEPAPRAAGDAEGKSGTGEALGGAESSEELTVGEAQALYGKTGIAEATPEGLIHRESGLVDVRWRSEEADR